MTPLAGIRHFVLDMDGTIYKSETWIDSALDFLRAVTDSGRDYIFLTNNSSKSQSLYLQKLRRMGLDVGPGQLLTSGGAAIYYLRKYFPGKKLYLLGNDILRKEFTEAGIILCEDNPDCAMSAFDTSLDYKKMQTFCDFIRVGIPYLATHPDANCPTKTGLMPDIGAIHAFVHASTGRWPDSIIGKPHTPMRDYLFEHTGWDPAETAAVGDRITTDVALAVNHGFTGVLVFSGATAKEDVALADIRPDYIFDSVKDMIPIVKAEA